MHYQKIKKYIDKFFNTHVSHKLIEYGYRTFKNRTCEGLTKKAILRYKNSKEKKPKSQIKNEIKICKRYWGCYPVHYFRYNLFLKKNELKSDELINYIPEYFFYNLFLPFYDNYEYRYVLEDKNTTELIFRSLKIPMPQKICSIIKNNIYNEKFKKVNFKYIENFIQSHKISKIVMKPNYGGGGRGIIIFNKNSKKKYITKNGILFEENILKEKGKKREYIIQAGVEQNKFLNEIYPYSTNTLRVITQNLNGDAKILYCILRIGRDGNEIDNLSKNGIFVEVKINSGEISEYAASKQCEYFYQHPNSEFVFGKKLIPEWNCIKNSITSWARKLPKYTYLGWDIALTETGPLVIEVNLGFGLDSIQILSKGMRNVFQIKNPKKYWNKNLKN